MGIDIDLKRGRKIIFVSETLHEYRLRFYTLVAEILHRSPACIQTTLIHGNAIYKDQSFPPLKLKYQKVHYYGRLTAQFLPTSVLGADMLIVGQETRHLNLYPLFLLHLLPPARKLALWGHGKNFQSRNPGSIQEKLKKLLTRHVHWFFAYNNRSAMVLSEMGYPAERTTIMMNAIDVSSLVAEKRRLTASQLASLRAELGIRTDNVGIYTGAMYSDKRMPFLIQACELIRTRVPDFEMIFIGGGDDAPLVEAAARNCKWLHYVGYKNNEDKVPYWAISKVFLMPGAVGLVILDSFALEVPMVTTGVGTHGPEIDYLENGLNGLTISDPDSLDDFAQAASELLLDERKRQELVKGCRASAPKYTVERSAELFSKGIIQALAAPHYRGRLSWL